jgi:hypothetical protein
MMRERPFTTISAAEPHQRGLFLKKTDFISQSIHICITTEKKTDELKKALLKTVSLFQNHILRFSIAAFDHVHTAT